MPMLIRSLPLGVNEALFKREIFRQCV